MTASPWRRVLAAILSRPRLAGAGVGALLLVLILLLSWLNWRDDLIARAKPVTGTVAAGAPLPAADWTPDRLRRFKKRHRRPDLAPPAESDALGSPRKPDLASQRDPSLPPGTPPDGPRSPQATPISEVSEPCPEGGTASAGLIREADGRITQSLVVEGPRFFDWKARRLFYLEAMVPDLRKELWRAELGVEYRLVRAGHLGVSGKLAVGDYALEAPGSAVLRDRLRVSTGVRLTWQ